ncbi:MAG: hypothetical protein ACYSUV_09745 [Planctomycetota bacterium]
MKNKKEEKWLDETIAQAADIGKLEFDRQKWKQKYLLTKSVDASRSHAEAKRHYSLWRFIMESKITRYSAAAVIVTALSLILLGPLAISTRNGVALGDVSKNMEDVETAVIRGRQVFTLIEDPNQSFEMDTIKYCSTQYGYAEKGLQDGRLLYYWSANVPRKLAIVVIPIWGKYLKYPLNDKQLRIAETLSPKGIVELFLEGGYEELGRSTIDGIEVEGFESRELKYMESIPKFFFDIREQTHRLWVGIEDLVPVRHEAEAVLGKCLFTGFNEVRVREECIFESYGIELDEAIFEPNIPADYTPLDFNLLSSGKTAKAGLVGVCAIPLGLVAWKKLASRRRRPVPGR